MKRIVISFALMAIVTSAIAQNSEYKNPKIIFEDTNATAWESGAAIKFIGNDILVLDRNGLRKYVQQENGNYKIVKIDNKATGCRLGFRRKNAC